MICDDLWFIHFEVKCVERLNIEDAMDQARQDAGGSMPVVAHKRKHRRWLVTLEAKDFFRLVRGDVPTSRGEHQPEGSEDRQDACPTGWRRIQGEPGGNMNDVTLRIPHVAGSSDKEKTTTQQTTEKEQ